MGNCDTKNNAGMAVKFRVFTFLMLAVTAVWGWTMVTGDPGTLNAADSDLSHDGYYISEFRQAVD